MKNLMYMKPDVLFAWLLYQSMLQQRLVAAQQQLIEMQQKIIALQEQIDKMRPRPLDEKKEFWHLVSGGIMSDEAANSDDLALVQKFYDWNIEFAKKHIKPYVDARAYQEALGQMTRGLPTRMAELETKATLNDLDRKLAEQSQTPAASKTKTTLRLVPEREPREKSKKLKQTAFLS